LLRQRPSGAAALESIPALGKARAEKYGPEFLALLRAALAETAEPAGV
jgi:hypothetical protein